MSKTVAAEEFEAHSRQFLHEARDTQEALVIMEHGKPLATVIPAIAPSHVSVELEPAAPRRNRTLEELRGSVRILGDIVEPLDDEWDAMK